jgi:hypothetical protein
MKKALIFLIMAVPLVVNAQRGFEIKVSGGHEFIGIDPWLNGNVITGTLLYNVSGIVAIGTSFTQGFGNKYYVEEKANSFDASLSEIILLTRLTFIRSGKIKVYGNLAIGQVSASTDEQVQLYGKNIRQKDKSIGLGIGAGGLLNLGGGFYWNFLEYHMSTLPYDFLDMDKGFQGSGGPMHTVKTGFAYTFSSK